MAILSPGAVLRAMRDALRRFNDKRGMVMCSHVAMSMLLALFPFLLFVVALAGTLTEDVQAESLINLVLGAWPDEIAEPMAQEIRAVTRGESSGLLTLGGILALYFASNGVDALRAAMTRAYHGEDQRPWWRQRLLSLLFVLGGAALLVVAALVGIVAPLYLRFVQDTAPALSLGLFTNETVRQGLAIFFLVASVTACHLWLPGGRHRLRDVWPGVLLTVLFWGAAGYGFGFYLERFARYSATYAGLAGAMSALIFLYLMAAILILGAELNGSLADEARAQEAEEDEA